MARSAKTAPDDCLTVWMMRLEIARRDCDYEAAATAICELRRLGVEVRFLPPAQEIKDA